MSLFRLSWRASAARIAGSVSVLTLLAACAPDLGPAARVKPAADYAVARSLGAPTTAVWPGQDWWTAYNDPQLNALIDEALKGSPDLKVAEARVRQAQARSQQAGAALLPSAGAKGNIQATAVQLNLAGIPASVKDALPNDWQPFTQIGANIDYQVDFFGKNRAGVAAASSLARASQFELAAARLQISTGVASAYADLVRLTADRAAAVDAVRVRGDSLTLVSDRLRNGLENQGQLAQSSAEANVSLGDVAALDARIDQARHQLGALVGAGPDRGLDITPNPASVGQPFGLPSNLAADLIGRRPDVAAARLRAEAAADKIKMAHADFYPNISLTGSVLDLSLSPDQIFSHNIILAQVGPAISLPIFQGGRLQGAYRGARAEYDEAVANYDKAVVQALHDVADAVSGQKALALQLGYARKALADSEKAYNLATLRYQGGLSPYLVVLTAESTLVAQRRAAADLQAQTLAGNIALVRALGGGFIDPNASNSPDVKGPSHG
ncbi:MAG: efflux system, outer rane lipoprotein NodT family [Caulobacteraceae bacterium]|nr:efflux system, outer rane lipoprotein NodT family [Caulobacteraceae bacterium]